MQKMQHIGLASAKFHIFTPPYLISSETPMTRSRYKTRDAAFQFRMGAGFAGDVNRTHPANIEPVINNATTPVLLAGLASLVDTATNTIRSIASGDTTMTVPYGVTVRAYPFQVASATNYGAQAFGTAALSASTLQDVLRAGYIMVQLPAGAATVTKGAPVFVWCAASSGAHVQGGFEAVATGGSTAALDVTRFSYNGPQDATGVVELSFNI
jgi:hypothetical protein